MCAKFLFAGPDKGDLIAIGREEASLSREDRLAERFEFRSAPRRRGNAR